MQPGPGVPVAPHPFAAQVVVAAGNKEKEKDASKEIAAQPLSETERYWATQLEAQKILNEKLSSHNDKLRQEIQRLTEQHLKTTVDWQKKFQQLTQHNQIFKEQSDFLQQKCNEQERTIKNLTQQLNQRNGDVFKLEGQIAEVYPQVMMQENFKKQVESFHEELLSWEQRVADEVVNSTRIQNQADTIKYKNELIDGLHTQIQTLNDKITALQSQALESREKLNQLQKERDEGKAALVRQKQTLETHKQIAQVRSDSLEEQYNFIKQINVRLEREILRLQTELQRATGKPSSAPEAVTSP